MENKSQYHNNKKSNTFQNSNINIDYWTFWNDVSVIWIASRKIINISCGKYYCKLQKMQIILDFIIYTYILIFTNNFHLFAHYKNCRIYIAFIVVSFLLPAFKVIYGAWKNRRQHYCYLKAFYKLFKILTHSCFEYTASLQKDFFLLFYFQNVTFKPQYIITQLQILSFQYQCDMECEHITVSDFLKILNKQAEFRNYMFYVSLNVH